MTNPTIRAVGDDDIGKVIALWHAAGVARPWNDPRKDIAFARRNAHSTLLVAEIEGEVVATAMVGEDGHRGWVYYVATAPSHQGKGLGRIMMTAAEDWLKRRGVWKMQLLVREENARGIEFYEHLGYRNTSTICLQRSLKDEPLKC